jgi:tape measure domain-containing protein
MAQKKIVKTEFNAQGNIKKKFTLWERAAARFGRKSERSFRQASRGASRFQSVVGGILAANVIGKGFDLARRGLFGFITEASKIEDATAAFTPLLGSVEKANTLVEMLNQTAATTPFQFENISDVANQLLPVMNGNLDETISTFRMLGDTAGGNVQKLDSITRGYVKALLKGKPDMEALNMIAEAGVPVFTEMAESMGITKKQLFDMSKQGKLTTADLTKTFKRMTSEGGIFFKGMEIASKTFTGKMSTLRDNIALAAASVGTAFLPTLKDLADRLIIVAGRVREWAIANQGLIQTKLNNFISGTVALFNQMKPLLVDVFNVWTSLGTIIKNTDFSGLVVTFKVMNTTLSFTLKTINLIAKGLNVIGQGLGITAGGLLSGTERRQQESKVRLERFRRQQAARQAPNQAEAAAKAQQVAVDVGGTINVSAPAGTTAESTGPVGFNMEALGAN